MSLIYEGKGIVSNGVVGVDGGREDLRCTGLRNSCRTLS